MKLPGTRSRMQVLALRCIGLALVVAAGCAQAQDRPAAPAGARADESIDDVLDRSERSRLDALQPADPGSERAMRVRASFQRLVATRAGLPAVELALMRGGVQAHAMLGHVLAVGEAVGELPENERLMLLAHELAHLWLDHRSAVHALYRRYVPGVVRPETTDPVAAALGRDAHGLAHRHEFEADAFAFALVRRLGVGLDDAASLLMRNVQVGDTATHPATRRRLARLRAAEDDEAVKARFGDESRAAQAGAAQTGAVVDAR